MNMSVYGAFSTILVHTSHSLPISDLNNNIFQVFPPLSYLLHSTDYHPFLLFPLLYLSWWSQIYISSPSSSSKPYTFIDNFLLSISEPFASSTSISTCLKQNLLFFCLINLILNGTTICTPCLVSFFPCTPYSQNWFCLLNTFQMHIFLIPTTVSLLQAATILLKYSR